MSVIATIYIIDDLEEQCDIFTKMLARNNYQIKSFNSGTLFLEESGYNEFGCILLDNQMPSVSGLDVQIELGKRNVHLPIIFISGESRYSEVVKAVRKGAFAFLQKPINKDDLNEEVTAAIKESERKLEVKRIELEYTQLLESLTPREKQVYNLVILGHTNKTVSAELSITLGTVEFHRSNLMKKLQAFTLADLMALSNKVEN